MVFTCSGIFTVSADSAFATASVPNRDMVLPVIGTIYVIILTEHVSRLHAAHRKRATPTNSLLPELQFHNVTNTVEQFNSRFEHVVEAIGAEVLPITWEYFWK